MGALVGCGPNGKPNHLLHAYSSLLTVYCLLLTAYYLLLTTCGLLLTADCKLQFFLHFAIIAEIAFPVLLHSAITRLLYYCFFSFGLGGLGLGAGAGALSLASEVPGSGFALRRACRSGRSQSCYVGQAVGLLNV